MSVTKEFTGPIDFHSIFFSYYGSQWDLRHNWNVFLRVKDIKTRALVGFDKYGNKYYEDNINFFCNNLQFWSELSL